MDDMTKAEKFLYTTPFGVFTIMVIGMWGLGTSAVLFWMFARWLVGASC